MMPPAHAVSDAVEYSVSKKDFRTITTQFCALGLIRQDKIQDNFYKPGHPEHEHRSWTLTRYGETYLAKLLAVHRQRNSNK